MGYDSLKAIGGDKDSYLAKQILDVRLRMDGLFELEEHAVQFVEEFIALYTNGPAAGGGIRYWQVISMLLLCWQANLLVLKHCSSDKYACADCRCMLHKLHGRMASIKVY